MSTLANQFTNPVEVNVIQGVTQVVPIAAQGPAGPTGPSGPNSISSTTALGSLTDYTANSPFVLASDPTSLLAGKIPLGSFGRSWLAMANQAAAQTALGLGTAAYQPTSAFDAAGSASAAYASAIAYSANANNLSSGTVAIGRLSGITTSQLSGTAGITNAQLANSSVTIGSTSVSLGGTAGTIAGLTLAAPALGTPASGTLTNCTGYATGNLSGTITNGQLAGSIAATKLVGTDITTVGALSSGSAASGFTVADACLSSNVPLKNAANTFTATQTISATLQQNGVLNFGGTADTSLNRASAGVINVRDIATTGGTGVAGLNFFSQSSLGVQQLGSDVSSWATATDSSRLAKRVIAVNAYSGSQTALTITATSSGTPTISIGGPTTIASTNGNYIKLPSMTVANLTSASTAGFGSTACVTDATATTAGTTVAGGGSNSVYVRSNGTNWIIF